MKIAIRTLLASICLATVVNILPQVSSAGARHWFASSTSCTRQTTFKPQNREQFGSCTQSGRPGFLGYYGVGIPIQFVKPPSMSLSHFNTLLASHNLKRLCAEARIVPAANLSLPKHMTEAQFDVANRRGSLLLTPCVTATMGRVDRYLASHYSRTG